MKHVSAETPMLYTISFLNEPSPAVLGALAEWWAQGLRCASLNGKTRAGAGAARSANNVALEAPRGSSAARGEEPVSEDGRTHG